MTEGARAQEAAGRWWQRWRPFGTDEHRRRSAADGRELYGNGEVPALRDRRDEKAGLRENCLLQLHRGYGKGRKDRPQARISGRKGLQNPP